MQSEASLESFISVIILHLKQSNEQLFINMLQSKWRSNSPKYTNVNFAPSLAFPQFSYIGTRPLVQLGNHISGEVRGEVWRLDWEIATFHHEPKCLWETTTFGQFEDRHYSK